ncbi:MAG TPA: LysM peptidoglycan-binding domain-containing protein [Opitutales bacterium]|nr:LysM peptidoglycan-binding domain-containing protein [Opitutales bacterium]
MKTIFPSRPSWLRLPLPLALAFALGVFGLHAQNPPGYVAPTSANPGAAPAPAPAPVSAATLASMNEDIQTLQRQVSQLRLNIEALQQDNDNLRKQLITQTDLNTAVQNAVNKNRDDVNKAITTAVSAATDALRKDIVGTVTKQIEALARDTNAQFQTLTQAMGKMPPPSKKITAVDPNTAPPAAGDVELYLVKPGESLSKIAAHFHVSVSDIIKVNPSIDPNKIREGQQIAIPLKDGAAPSAVSN